MAVPENEAEVVAAAAVIQGEGRSRNPPAEETTRSKFSDGKERAVFGKLKGGRWERAQKPSGRSPEEEEAGRSRRSQLCIVPLQTMFRSLTCP